MSDQIAAAMINARVARALIKLEAMKAENKVREYMNEFPAYTEKDIMNIIDEEGIGFNSLIPVVHGESY